MKRIKKLVGALMAVGVAVSCVVAPAVSGAPMNTLAPVSVAHAETRVDVTQKASAYGWESQNELKITYLDLGAGVMLDAIGYGVIDNAGYQYVQDYVAINGRTIREINSDASLGAGSWTYTVFPSTAATKYKVPVIVFINNGLMEIKIHSNYVAMLGSKVEITAKAGLYFQNSGTMYEVKEDKTFTVWQEVAVTDENIADKITLTGWDATGDKAELTYTRLVFGQDVLPAGIDYGVLDKSDYQYLQKYILLNGKSLQQINAETDTSSYVFSTFPSNAADFYKIPVIIFANAGALEIKIHNDYLKTLGESIEITVKEGLYVKNGNTRYIVEKDIEYKLVENVWVDKNKTYSITYYLNGVQYGEVDYALANTKLDLRDAPTFDAGYSFGGWEYGSITTVVQDMAIYGYVKPIRYTVTYVLGGGVNASTNPIVYYVTDGEIALKDGTKEGAIFKGWYTSETYDEKVESLSPDRLGDITLYALFEDVDSGENESGCGSVVALPCGAILLAVAVALKKKKR